MPVELIPILKTKKGKAPQDRTVPPRAYYFKGWHTRISLKVAEEEPLDQRLFPGV